MSDLSSLLNKAFEMLSNPHPLVSDEDHLYMPYSWYKRWSKEEWLSEQRNTIPHCEFIFVKGDVFSKESNVKLFRLNEKGELELIWKD